MAHPRPAYDELLTRFLRMLAPFPVEVDVVSQNGDPARLLMADLDDGRIVAYGPQLLMLDGLVMTVQLRDPGGGGFDVILTVVRSFFQAGDQTLLHLEVTSIEERAGHRDTPRVRLSDSASISVVRSNRLHTGHEFQARLADLSETGLAFLTELPLATGDIVRVDTDVDGSPVTVEARVVRIDTASFGRARVGCEVVHLEQQSRTAIVGAAGEQVDGSAEQRRPRAAEAREQHLAERKALHSRIHQRRYPDEG
jgi:hypothetical protein